MALLEERLRVWPMSTLTGERNSLSVADGGLCKEWTAGFARLGSPDC